MIVGQPLQRERDKRWDYTEGSGSSGPYAVGYCNPRGAEHDPEHAAKYHNTGHATPEEAVECHARYEVERMLQFGVSEKEQRRCVVCDAWTQKRAFFRGDSPRFYDLCETHATTEVVLRLHTAKRSGNDRPREPLIVEVPTVISRLVKASER